MDEALELTKKWDYAVLDKNVEALLDLVADDYTRTYSFGKVTGKEQLRTYLTQMFDKYNFTTAYSKELFITPSKGYLVVSGDWKGVTDDGREFQYEWSDARKKINGKWVFTYHKILHV